MGCESISGLSLAINSLDLNRCVLQTFLNEGSENGKWRWIFAFDRCVTSRYFTHHITKLSNVTKTFANKGLKFLNLCSFKLEVKKITKKIGFARQVYVGSLLIAIHLVYRLVFWFSSACFVMSNQFNLRTALQTRAKYRKWCWIFALSGSAARHHKNFAATKK